MTQEEMGNVILKIQDAVTDINKEITGIKNEITGIKEENKKRDDMILNIQNTLIMMQQENNKRFNSIDDRLEKLENRTSNIENDVSFSLDFIMKKTSEMFGTSNNDKFKSKSHMQILENHEERISLLESKKVANQ